MKTLVLAVLIAVAAVPALAQSSTDFSITLTAHDGNRNPVTRMGLGENVFYVVQWQANGGVNPNDIVVEIDVPGTVAHINDRVGLTCDTSSDPIRCTIDLNSGPHGFVQLEMPIATAGTLDATARIIHQDGTPDPNPANDVATHSFVAVAAPSLHLNVNIPLFRVEPSSPGRFSVEIHNSAVLPATNVVVTASLPSGGTIHSAEPRVGHATCTVTNNTLVCTTPSLPQHQFLIIDAFITAPSRTDGADLVVQANVTASPEDVDPSDNQITRSTSMIRQFVVTNVHDDGGGSLRQALHDANALCQAPQACAILFRIPAPVPSDGWFTIQPLTPLPIVTASLTIDGRTQALFTGDTNADGPEIEINGALVPDDSGLRLRPNCDMVIRNLAVNGFPGYGIEVRTPATLGSLESCGGAEVIGAILRENYIGTDPRGRTAKPNHRGLGIFTTEAFVQDNVISGNRRAGIFAEDGGYYAITGNKIGAGADGSRVGNGAGIFINMGTVEFNFVGADIHENVIAYNDGMAIARTRRGEILVLRNSIFDNLQQGIDVDLDGPSPRHTDVVGAPNAPVLFSAEYDAAQNATIVRGRIDNEMFGHSHNIEVFASARLSVWGQPQAEQSLQIASIGSGHTDLNMVIPGDLRGKWITATYNVSRHFGFVRTNARDIGTESHRAGQPGDTSELSNAVMVH